MPITSSAKKALRSSLRKKAMNDERKKIMRGAVKNVKKLVSLKKYADAARDLPAAYAAIDKAAKTGVIKKNAAARKKSRLALLVKKTT